MFQPKNMGHNSHDALNVGIRNLALDKKVSGLTLHSRLRLHAMYYSTTKYV